MQADGVGGWMAEIAVAVERPYESVAAARLSQAPLSDPDGPSAQFRVKVPVRRCGDDDAIIWHLSQTLDGASPLIEWNVMWKDSKF